jgi:hypothetical protein
MRNLILILASILPAHVSFAQEYASIPYRALYQAAQTDFANGTDTPRLDQTVTFSVRSVRDDVSPQEIRLTLTTKNARTSLIVSDIGEFNLPLSKELADDGAIVLSNQPKGSLILSAALIASYSLDRKIEDGFAKIRYTRLFPFDRIRTQAAAITDKPERVRFPKSAAIFANKSYNRDATVTIVVGSNKTALRSDENGNYRIEYDSALAKQNAWIWLKPHDGWRVTPDRPEHSLSLDQAEPSDEPKSR